MVKLVGPDCDYEHYYTTGPKVFGPFDTFQDAKYYDRDGPQLMVLCSKDGQDSLFLNDKLLAKKEQIKVFAVDPAGRPFFTFHTKGKGWFISYNGREFGPVDQVLGSRTDKVNGFLSLVRKEGSDHLLSPQGWAGPYGRILSWNASLSGQGEPVLETVRTDGTQYIWHGNVAYGPYSKVIVDREPGVSEDGKHCWYAAVRWGGTDLHAYLDGEPIGPAVDAIKPEMAYCEKLETLAFAGKRQDSWSVFFNGNWLEGGYSDIDIKHGVNSEFGFVALGTEKGEGAADRRIVLTATATYGPFDKTALYVTVSPSGTTWAARVHNEAGWRVLLDGVSSPSLASVFDGFGGPIWTADGRIVVLGTDKEGSLIRLVGRSQTERE